MIKRNVLTVFIATPGDLVKERNILREVVERINKSIGRNIGWNLELLGWEDTLPSFARPQELINKDVECCDLFIGVLWKRWGQPTNKYDSGFEEEFRLARKRKVRGEHPEIWLFFKKIDEENLKDPGEQLKKVLNFRKEQIEKKELLFKEFTTLSDWEKLIHDLAIQYILDLYLKEEEKIVEEQSIVVSSQDESFLTKYAKKEPSKESYPTDLISAFKKSIRYLQNEEGITLDLWDRLRLFVQSSAWFSEQHSGELFGGHEANLAYLAKKKWKLSHEEIWFWFRTLIKDKDNIVPGWYWLRDLGENYIDYMLCYFATNDSDADIRRNAFNLLADTDYKPSRELLEKGLNNSDKKVVLSTIRLFKNIDSKECIELLNSFIDGGNIDDEEIKSEATVTWIYLSFKSDENQILSEIIGSGVNMPRFLRKRFTSTEKKFDKEILLKALDKAQPSVRRFAVNYFKKNKMLTKDICKKLFVDPDVDIRKEGLIGFIDLGGKVDMELVRKLFPEPKERVGLARFMRSVKADDFVPLILKKKDPKYLLNSLSFYDIDSALSYRILAIDHFELIRDRIRSNLDDEFTAFMLSSRSLLKEKYGTSAGKIINLKPDVEQFAKHKFVSSALAGLAENGEESDAKYARKFLGKTSSNDIDNEAINILSKFGDSSDAENIVKIALEMANMSNQFFALKTCLKLSNSKEELLTKLLDADERGVAKIIANNVIDCDSKFRTETAKKMLFSKHENSRLVGLNILLNDFDNEKLENLLEDYVSKDSYYYNVVSWLDKYLYASGRYKKYFQSTLKNYFFRSL